ncbi:MAG: hypothetical protein Q9217_002575 [Psora testacea]
MASVTSLDKDMRNIRLSKYTPQAANEARMWIEDTLGERLKPGDLLEALKDGLALCKLVNLAAPPGVRFKESSMPFVQMENISHFLRACQKPPLNLPSHDIFQTVDLYESKDPAQVLQCIAAFSRRARVVQPNKFHRTIGEKNKAGAVTPQSTGSYSAASPKCGRSRGLSYTTDTASTASSQPSQSVGGRVSPVKSLISDSSTPVNGGMSTPSSGGVSSWSKRADEGATTPAWNIHQYGYMGGATQGNQGITFGARRQITTPAPKVPSLADKERKRREQEAEAERLRILAEEAERKRRVEREAEEERERLAEDRRLEEETQRQREREKQRVEEEKRRWKEEERKWKEEEEVRAREEQEAEARLASERSRKQAASDVRLTGQFLSQYQAEKKQQPSRGESEKDAERARIQELERQLEEAKAREAQYERERQERIRADQERERSRSRPVREQGDRSRSNSQTRPVPNSRKQETLDSWQVDEREYLRKQWAKPPAQPSDPVPPPQPPRPLPTPQISKPSPVEELSPSPSPPTIAALPPRPLPNPATYAVRPPSTSPTRKSPFTRPTSTPSPPSQVTPAHHQTPKTATNPLKKPPFANPSSLLSREMELDRQRQAEWEEAQKASKAAAASGIKGEGTAPGDGAWDVHQYGYLGGDSQNRGGTGIGFGMGRRQLVGPREPPGKGGVGL